MIQGKDLDNSAGNGVTTSSQKHSVVNSREQGSTM